MRRARLCSLLSLLLALPGCASQPTGLVLGRPASVTPGNPLSSPGRSLTVELAAQRQVQATLSRNLVSMLDHYTATLLMWDGSSFVPLPTPLAVSTSEIAHPKFAFDHLGPGRYQVRAIGYDASNTALTSEGTADIDLTGNDVDMAPQVTVAMSMLPVVFSATLPLPSNATTPGSVPAWVTGLEAVVKVGPTEIARHSYLPNQTPNLKNLAAGVSYDVSVTASSGLGYSNTDTYAYFADPNAASLGDAPTRAFSWTPPEPVSSVANLGWGPNCVVLDPSGNTWVSVQNEERVVRISTTGSKSTFTVGNQPWALASDALGNIWVPNRGTNDVTRISTTGSLSTFSAGDRPTAVTVDSAGNAWVPNYGTDDVTRISATGSVSTFGVGSVPQHVAVDAGGNAWVTSSDKVTRISSTGSVFNFNIGWDFGAVAVDAGGNAWVASYNINKMIRISTTGSLTTYNVGTDPHAVALDQGGNVWVVNRGSNNVTRISTTGSLSTYAVGSSPHALAVDVDGTVWVANESSDNVTRISSTGSLSTYAVGSDPSAVAVDAKGSVWVTNYSSGDITKLAY